MLKLQLENPLGFSELYNPPHEPRCRRSGLLCPLPARLSPLRQAPGLQGIPVWIRPGEPRPTSWAMESTMSRRTDLCSLAITTPRLRASLPCWGLPLRSSGVGSLLSLWVVLGSLLIGAVHDFSALVVSMRNRGVSIGKVAEKIIGKRAKTLFHLIIFFLIALAMGVFVTVTATLLGTGYNPEAIYPERDADGGCGGRGLAGLQAGRVDSTGDDCRICDHPVRAYG